VVGAVWESYDVADTTVQRQFPEAQAVNRSASSTARISSVSGATRRVRVLRGRLVLAEGVLTVAVTALAVGVGLVTVVQSALLAGLWIAARLAVAVRRGPRALALVDAVGVLETGLVVLASHAVVAGLVTDGGGLRPALVVTGALVAGALLSATGVALLHGRPRVLVLDDAAHPTSGAAPGQVDVVATGVVDAGTGAAVGVEDDGDVVPLEESVRRHAVDLVVVSPAVRLTPAAVRGLSWQLDRTRTPAVLGGAAVASRRLGIGRLGGRSVLTVAPPRPSVVVRVVKSALDRAVALAALVVALPVLVVLGVLVRLDSPGPALFRQVRVGRDGRPFVMLKLRTMTTDAEMVRLTLADLNEADTMLFKIRADPRVTRVGAWLRRSSLDEVPQLWNVVRGDMSLVGPRPALPDEVARYDRVARRRLAVKPGLTGLWQVSGRSDLSWADALELDVTYIDNHSLTGDLAICARTVPAVVQARGAY